MAFKRLLAAVVCAALCVLAAPVGAFAASHGQYSSNAHANNYTVRSETVKSQLRYDGDSYTRAEYSSALGKIIVERYDEDFEFIEGGLLELSLPIFGGIYLGEKCNYVVTGQMNAQESDSVETFRITKYSLDWEEIAHASLYGANTVEPFRAGRVSMVEYGGYLYIRTSHTMYTAEDGKNHQANVAIIVDTASMTVTDSRYGISYIGTGYVSHSFNQLLAVDEGSGSLIAMDHGDAYPRALVMTKYSGVAGSSRYVNPLNYNVLNMPGAIGANATGASVGGLEAGKNGYLTAYSCVDYTVDSVTRNAYFASVSPDMSKCFIVPLTGYSGDVLGVGTPQLVKVDEDLFCVLWENMDENGYDGTFSYIYFDSSGEALDVVKTCKGMLSDCKPIVVDGDLVWYVTANSAPVFMRLERGSDSPIAGECTHVAPDSEQAYDVCPTKGKNRLVCSLCGKYFTEEIDFSAHKDDDGDKMCDLCGFPMPTDGAEAKIVWEQQVVTQGTQMVEYSVEGGSISSLDNVYVSAINVAYGYRGDYAYFVTENLPCGVYRVFVVLDSGEVVSSCFQIVDSLPVQSEEHTYTSEIVPPTCTEGGYTIYTCTECGHSYIEDETPALGHKYVYVAPVEPTCSEPGRTEGFACSGCGKVIEGCMETDTLEHTFEPVAEIEPTCVEPGGTLCRCTQCGFEQTEATVPALGHTVAVEKGYAPTCTQEGLSDGEYCLVCGEVLALQQPIEKLEHDYVAVLTNPTCTNGGYTTFTCAECGLSYTGDETPALGHTPGEWETVTEGEDGAEKEQRVCLVCGEVLDVRDVGDDTPEVILGDANGDGKVTASDARLALRASARLETTTEHILAAADFDKNGKVSASEARKILRVSAKLESFD